MHQRSQTTVPERAAPGPEAGVPQRPPPAVPQRSPPTVQQCAPPAVPQRARPGVLERAPSTVPQRAPSTVPAGAQTAVLSRPACLRPIIFTRSFTAFQKPPGSNRPPLSIQSLIYQLIYYYL